ncbi:hypothetical protein FOQG_12043 [Fusarium oxysporum f. sp. raphani 54005]|uniref:Uncharacterized protein n=3 Tax=Fusarium oxysporum TaxID=5507 RepID=X0BPD5_FUSOX|nr:hypothetical protein FOVG_11588 [Fusarium oxysporum f. sp. pisi HDV247]EXK83686.1 hypothetical protein FOQG_12043 [Fusarium oxysporum f. sp. raphani 54005]EXL78774.1 hypothetical protein FOPG_07215 [Fusarium oxysporum f. sp. conglutinans race 2 54008]
MENPAQQRHFQFRLYSPRSGPERDLTASTFESRRPGGAGTSFRADLKLQVRVQY